MVLGKEVHSQDHIQFIKLKQNQIDLYRMQHSQTLLCKSLHTRSTKNALLQGVLISIPLSKASILQFKVLACHREIKECATLESNNTGVEELQIINKPMFM